MVKPRRMESVKLSELLGGFLGETSVDRSLWEDPVLTVGFRDYTGREPFRSIHWLRAPKAGGWWCASMTIPWIRPVRSFLIRMEKEESLGKWLELCCRAARQVCEELEKRKIAYDFQTNGVIAGAMGEWRDRGERFGSRPPGNGFRGPWENDRRLSGNRCGMALAIGNGINSRTG